MAPYFLATKFEAFKDRGHNDVFVSHDLEDILTVVEGRANLVQAVNVAPDNVRLHIGQSVVSLLDLPAFTNALPGLLSDPEREEVAFARLSQMSLLVRA